ncbi:MAG: hypothetical protein IT440_02945 [Phycisphaeraceae bacterium]|nr:hypothetical protein [Phycisphaeraceae bacterium]
MRWPVFAILAYLFLGLETGLRGLLSLGGHTSPSFVLILMVFLGLYAAPTQALTASLILGLLVDFTRPVAVDDLTTVVIPGPMAIGFFVGAIMALQLRGLVRRSLIGLAATVFIAGIFVHLIVVALLTLRGLPWLLAHPIPAWSASDQMVRAFFELLYSSLLALPLGYLLGRFHKWFVYDLGKAGFAGYTMR